MGFTSKKGLAAGEKPSDGVSVSRQAILGATGKDSCGAGRAGRCCKRLRDPHGDIRSRQNSLDQSEVDASGAVSSAAVAARAAKARTAPKANDATRLTFDLPLVIRQVREHQSLSVSKLAELIGCAGDDVVAVEAGEGRAAILARMMDALKVDVTGLKSDRQLYRRLSLTRDARGWTVERLAQRSGLSHSAIIDLENGRGLVADLLTVLPVLGRAVRVRSRDPHNKSADKDSRFTPVNIAAAIERAFGRIVLDPCSHPSSPVQAAHQVTKAMGGDGLDHTWSGEVVFVNPPYSRSSDWLRKVISEWQRAGIRILLCLVNSKTDAAAFHQALCLGADVFFLEGRVKYIKPDGTSEPSKQPTMLLAFGATPEQQQAFAVAVRGTWMARSCFNNL